jgi:hypothetical protein
MAEDKESPLVVFGFARGLEPEEILDVTFFTGPAMFVIKWKTSDIVDLVPYWEVERKCPELILKFYQERNDKQ